MAILAATSLLIPWKTGKPAQRRVSRRLPAPPTSPPLFVCVGETAKRHPFVGTFRVGLLAETPGFRTLPRLCAKSLWRPISAPTPSCWREFESSSGRSWGRFLPFCRLAFGAAYAGSFGKNSWHLERLITFHPAHCQRITEAPLLRRVH